MKIYSTMYSVHQSTPKLTVYIFEKVFKITYVWATTEKRCIPEN